MKTLHKMPEFMREAWIRAEMHRCLEPSHEPFYNMKHGLVYIPNNNKNVNNKNIKGHFIN